MKIQVLVRCEKKNGGHEENTTELHAIYFIGSDTTISDCKLFSCNDIKNLYKLHENGKELVKTDITIKTDEKYKMNEKKESVSVYPDYIIELQNYIIELQNYIIESYGNNLTTIDFLTNAGLKLEKKGVLTSLLRSAVVNAKESSALFGNIGVGALRIASQSQGGKRTRKNTLKNSRRRRYIMK